MSNDQTNWDLQAVREAMRPAGTFVPSFEIAERVGILSYERIDLLCEALVGRGEALADRKPGGWSYCLKPAPKTPLTSEYIKATFPGLASDLAHWADYGISTVEALGDYLDTAAAINVYKDENGYKPHFADADEARAYLDSRQADAEPATIGFSDLFEWDD